MRDFTKSNSIIKKLFYCFSRFLYAKFLSCIIKPLPKKQINLEFLSLDCLDEEKQKHWRERIADVLSSPDNRYIPRESDAGKIKNGSLIMHNGLKIDPLSYCGYPMLKMLMENRGAHEPQEERVFYEILKKLPIRSVMIELGSYWAFYSMWFHRKVKHPTCYMVEPNRTCLQTGKNNFILNKMHGNFLRAFVGDSSFVNEKGDKTICIDDFVEQNKIKFVHVLHADVQGKELEMLKGSRNLFDNKKVGYVFVSTHSNDLHSECLSILNNYNFIILASANLDETYSYDGLIAARAPYFDGIDPLQISLKSKANSVCPGI
ncbi:MAG: FkbM family methyltransferase [Candidatus Marinimicrobia bacterium]|jgi:hypothetical protein|nr:FkbM family methyltransferase [Candidatus Neomarinimicrobiota bacterium]